jgi:hypothetical protein
VRPTEKDISAFKREFRKSGIVKHASLAAGYSENVSNMGLTPLPTAIKTFVHSRRKKLAKLAQIAHEFDAKEQENVVRGALLANVAAGKDQACKSLELLGKDKRVSMFQQDSQTGIIVIQAASLPSFEGVPKLPAVIDAQIESNERK